jgi:hypothetical protein
MDRRKRVIVSTEVAEKSGIRTQTARHFICLIKEVKKGENVTQPLPYLYVLKERNRREQRQRFFCRIKGSIYAVNNDRLFIIYFAHSLKINLKMVSAMKEQHFES